MKRNQSQEQIAKEKKGNVHICARVKPTQEGDQSIFSGDDETGRSVVASKQPQKSRLVSTYYKNDKDLEKINEIFPDRADVFQLDKVFSQKSSQEIFYRYTKEAVSRVVSGQNVSILIYGPSRCGKTFTFTGAQNHQKGLMFRCVDDLLSKIEVANEKDSQYTLQLSIFAVYNNEIFDLLSNENQDYEVVEYSPNEVRINGLVNDFKNKYVQALKRISSLCQVLNEKKVYEKSHVVVQFNVQEGESSNFKLNLVRLADTDLVEKQANGDDFEVIEQHINQINQNSGNNRSNKKSKLTACIKDTLNENAQSYFICCVSSSTNQYTQSLFALDQLQALIQIWMIYFLLSIFYFIPHQEEPFQMFEKSKLKASINNIQILFQFTQKLCPQAGHHDLSEVRSQNSNINASHNMNYSSKKLTSTKPPISPNSMRSGFLDGGQKSTLSQSNLRPTNTFGSNNYLPNQNQGNQNTQMEYIMTEAENIYNDIRKQSRLFGRLPERERDEWVSQKERILNDLQRQIEAEPYNRDIPYCETLLTKCQRQLRLINPNISDQRQISGSPPRGNATGYMQTSNINQQNMSNSFSRSNHIRKQSQASQGASAYAEQFGRLSPSQENRQNDYEFLKDKEDKLDKDFMRLLDRYNHSKELIESLNHPAPQNQFQSTQINQPFQQSQRIQTQTSQSQRSPIENLHKNSQMLLSPQQQRTIDLSGVPQQKQFNDDLYRSQDSSGFLDQPRNKIGSQNIGDLSPTLDMNILEEKEKNVGQSLKRLKETIEIKDNIEKSKLQKLRQLNKELKHSLREYVEKCEEVTEILNNKDSEIEKFEYELRQAQEDILLNVDTIKEYKIKEQGWLQMEEELREANMQLKTKLLKKKKKVSQIKEECKQKEEEVVIQQKQFEDDIQKYQKTVQEQEEIKSVDQNKATSLNEIINQLRNDIEQRDQEQKQVHQNLQDMRQLNQEFSQKYQSEVIEKNEAINQNHVLSRKKEELEEQVQKLEQKIQKHKQKFENQKNKIIEEKNQEINKKKEKVKVLKTSLSETEAKLSDLEGKYQNLVKHADDLEFQLKETTNYLNELKDIKDEQTLKIAKLTEEKNSAYLEIERLQNLVSNLEGKVEKYEASQLVDAKLINELKEEVSHLSDQIQRKDEDLCQANEHIQQIQDSYNMELNNFEIKLDQILQEYASCKDENAEFKKKEIENKKLLTNLEEQVEKYKEKYLKAKHSNKNLQINLKEVESRVKEYVTERQIEMQSQALERERKNKVEQTQKNKLRVLDEIQQMIKSHKQHILPNRYEQ